MEHVVAVRFDSPAGAVTRGAPDGTLHLAMKILYKPFAIIAGVIGAKLGRNTFKALWARIDAADPPDPTTAGASLPKVVTAAALEAATMAGIAAAVDRMSARFFHHLTGIWPGKKTEQLPPPSDDTQS